MEEKSFIPELTSVHDIQAFVNRTLSGKIRDKSRCLKIDLIVEEIVVNIINYGFADRDGGVITVTIADQSSDRAVLAFIDNGIPFNPLEKEPPDTQASLENRQPGGLGVFLVKQIASAIHYDRKDGFNRLTLEIDLTQ